MLKSQNEKKSMKPNMYSNRFQAVGKNVPSEFMKLS